MAQNEFDEVLAEVMNEGPASALLSVPGVYEAVSEYFNNDVLRIMDERVEASQEYDADSANRGD